MIVCDRNSVFEETILQQSKSSNSYVNFADCGCSASSKSESLGGEVFNEFEVYIGDGTRRAGSRLSAHIQAHTYCEVLDLDRQKRSVR